MTGAGSQLPSGGRGMSVFALIVVLAVIAWVHMLAWAQHPPDVDPINFVVSLHEFDISRDAPHPPGYPLYVGLARLAQLLIGPDHAFQLVNLVMMLATSALLAVIGSQLGSRQAGMLAAILFALHPLVWAGTVIQECYVSDALGGAALVACGLAFGQWRYRALALFFVIELAIGLLRPTSCLLLLPAGLTAIWLSAADDRDRLRLLALATGAAGIALGMAYAATVTLTGGLEVYRSAIDRVMGAAFRSNSVLGGATLRTHIAMVNRLLFWFALWSAPLILLAAVNRMVGSNRDWRPVTLLLLAWIAPALCFYTAIYYLKPTYQIVFVPALSLGCSWCLSTLARPQRVLTGAITALASVGQGFFWLGGDHLSEPLYRLTHAYFAKQDRAWEQLAGAVKDAPVDCVIIHPSWSDLTPSALRLITHDGTYAVRDEQGQTMINANGLWLTRPLSDHRCLRTLPTH